MIDGLTEAVTVPGKNKIKYREHYSRSSFLISKTDLLFELEPESTTVTSSLTILPVLDSSQQTLVLDGENLQLKSLKINNVELHEADYKYEAGLLTIFKVPGKAFNLTSEVMINPTSNTALSGLYLSNNKFCTQCEAEGFRRITFYLDRPDILSVFTTTIIADKEKFPYLLSNGNLLQRSALEHNRIQLVWHDPYPKPSYLFALVAGKFDLLEDSFLTMSGRKIQLQIFVDEGKLKQTKHAMNSLKKAMRWDEKIFSREYDLDIYMVVAVGDFNMGAMENKGLNVFNTKYVLADKTTATDDDFLGIESVIAHEYFHNWTGNRITCRDWFQLSLKEGLTVFRDQEFTSDLNSRAVKRIADVQVIKSVQFAEDAGPMAHPVRPDSYIEMNNFYTVTVYNKGAEVIRMMQTIMGKENFIKGMDCYFERHDGEAVTCEDFVLAMEYASEINLQQFRLWYSQSGTPGVTVLEEKYVKSSACFKLSLSQHSATCVAQDKRQNFHIPLKVGFINDKGEDVTVSFKGVRSHEFVLDLVDKKNDYLFEEIKEKVTISILRDFSAPVIIHREISNATLAFLFSYDTNEYSRWDAGQSLMARAVWSIYDDNINKNDKNSGVELENAVCQALGKLLKDKLDPQFSALLLKIPSVSMLEVSRENIDILVLHKARNRLIKKLAVELENSFVDTFKNARKMLHNCPKIKAIGYREISTTCLFYIKESNPVLAEKLAWNIFNQPQNMTEELTVFQMLASLPEADEVAETFYKKWQHEELVLDKWFMTIASSGEEQAFERVKLLWNHEAMVHSNPNKVRALLTSFAANVAAFHQQSGDGYSWYADRVIEMDSLNPQISARLVSVFNRWKKYDKPRQRQMLNALKKIKARKALSADVSEIVDKALSLS